LLEVDTLAVVIERPLVFELADIMLVVPAGTIWQK